MLIGSVSPHTYTVIVGLLPVTEGTRIASTQLNGACGWGREERGGGVWDMDLGRRGVEVRGLVRWLLGCDPVRLVTT